MRGRHAEFRAFADASPSWEEWISPDGERVYVSPACERISGYSPADLMAGPELWVRLVHPDDRGRWEAHQRVHATRAERGRIELRVVRADGEVRRVEHVCTPVLDGAGRYLGRRCTISPIGEGALGSALAVEEALAAQQVLLDAIVDNIPVLLCIWDPALKRFWFNRHMRAVLGWTEDDVADGAFMERVYPDPDYRRDVIEYMLSLETGWRDLRSAAKDGRIVDISWANVRLPDGTTIGIGVDVRERKRAELELRASRDELARLAASLEDRVWQRTADLERRTEQLRELHAELSEAEQRERRQLAELLHDGLQQLLVAAKMQVGAVRSRPDEAVGSRLDEVDELLAQSIDASRSLTMELSPPALHERGLIPALHWLGRRTEEKQGLSVRVTAPEALEPGDRDVGLLLYQSARELLLNIVKHAGVSEAELTLGRDDDDLCLLVADAGSGFDPSGTNSASTYGLVSVRQRIEWLGGTMQVESAPGRGTRVSLRVPTAVTRTARR